MLQSSKTSAINIKPGLEPIKWIGEAPIVNVEGASATRNSGVLQATGGKHLQSSHTHSGGHLNLQAERPPPLLS